MPTLRCPRCGFSDLQAIDVETVQQDAGSKDGVRRVILRELGCNRCGWSPSKAADRELVLSSPPGKSQK